MGLHCYSKGETEQEQLWKLYKTLRRLGLIVQLGHTRHVWRRSNKAGSNNEKQQELHEENSSKCSVRERIRMMDYSKAEAEGVEIKTVGEHGQNKRP